MDNFSELAKSVLSFSSAATLFGTSQVGRLLDRRGARRPGDRVAYRLDHVIHAAGRSFEDPLWTAFTRADATQRALVDVIADIVRLDPAGLLASSGPLLQPALSALTPLISAIDRVIPDRAIELQWLELNNKIEIYFLVQNVVARLGISPHERAPLPELMERAYALGPFLTLWAVEGLGHHYAAEAMKDDAAPRGLLTGVEAEDVPSGALLMLHAGIGLAFAQKLLGSIRTRTPRSDVRVTVEKFYRLCRHNSRPGYVGAAYESLGLVACTFHPQLLEVLDREVQSLGEELLGFFWHGVGRAIYFAPRNFLPCSRINWARVGEAAPHQIGRINIIAGLAWATTLVNMRQPAIIERVLRGLGENPARDPAFAYGVATSVALRSDTTPDAEMLVGLVQYRPGPDDTMFESLWDDVVRQPSKWAICELAPTLRRSNRLDQLFHTISSWPPAAKWKTSTGTAPDGNRPAESQPPTSEANWRPVPQGALPRDVATNQRIATARPIHGIH